MKVETNVPEIMKRDGVENRIFDDVNLSYYNIDDIIRRMPKKKSWCYRLIDTENNSATLIAQMPNEGNRRHKHPDWNEWWFILKGKAFYESYSPRLHHGLTCYIRKGDIVFISKGTIHQIKAVGKKQCIRLAVSRGDVKHVYE